MDICGIIWSNLLRQVKKIPARRRLWEWAENAKRLGPNEKRIKKEKRPELERKFKLQSSNNRIKLTCAAI